MSLFHIYMPHRRRRIIGCTMMSKVPKRSVLCLESRYDMKVAFYRIFCMWCIWSLYIVDICMCNILCVGLFFVIPLVRFGRTAVDCRFAEIERSLLQTSCRVWDKNGSPFFPRRERINHRCLAFNSKVLDEKEKPLEDGVNMRQGKCHVWGHLILWTRPGLVAFAVASSLLSRNSHASSDLQLIK